MSKVNRPRINGQISRLVHEHWKSDHSMTIILAQADLIRALQEFSDRNIEAALKQGYDEGCHETIADMESKDLLDWPKGERGH